MPAAMPRRNSPRASMKATLFCGRKFHAVRFLEPPVQVGEAGGGVAFQQLNRATQQTRRRKTRLTASTRSIEIIQRLVEIALLDINLSAVERRFDRGGGSPAPARMLVKSAMAAVRCHFASQGTHPG